MTRLLGLAAFPEAAPIEGAIGGALIGLAAFIMLFGAGRIAGVSGITARALSLGGSSLGAFPSWAFLIGLPIGAMIVAAQVGVPQFEFTNPVFLVIAGLLVGFGARLGSGCTSGHGVCGMSRLSVRSIVATLTFMAAGIATVAVMNVAGIEVLS